MQKLAHFAFLALACLVSAATADPPPATQPAAQQVVIDNFTFTPATLTISAGTKVKWINHDDIPHTVTSTTQPRELKSEALDTDQTYSHTFAKPGTYHYFCAIHPHMTAVVIVK